MSEAITDADIQDSAEYPTLGPAYYSARRFAEEFVSGAEGEQFKPVVEKIVNDLHDELWTRVSENMVYSVESAVQAHIWQTVDSIVGYLLSGEKWAMEKYALGTRYECDKIRAAIAAHIPKELQDARIADMEDELKRLRSDLEWARKR
jgi:uncharacterized protein (UPF0297 family)